jgi:hypothetical protein
MYDKDFWVMWRKWLFDIDKSEKEVAIKVGILPSNLNRSINNCGISAKNLIKILNGYGYGYGYALTFTKKDKKP